MNVTGRVLLLKIGTLLLDPDGDVWGPYDKVRAVNEALNLIALLRPDATAKTEEVALTADTPKQSIPSGGVRFLDILWNKDGAPVRKIKRETLNETIPGWTTETAAAIEHYMFDEENPKTFLVYPVPNAAITVELVYSSVPDEFKENSTTFPIAAIYEAPVIEYVLYRLLSMEGKGQDIVKASAHLNAFYNALGIKTRSDAILQQVQES